MSESWIHECTIGTRADGYMQVHYYAQPEGKTSGSPRVEARICADWALSKLSIMFDGYDCIAAAHEVMAHIHRRMTREGAGVNFFDPHLRNPGNSRIEQREIIVSAATPAAVDSIIKALIGMFPSVRRELGAH